MRLMSVPFMMLLAAGCATNPVAEKSDVPEPIAVTDVAFETDATQWNPELGKWELHYLARVEKFHAENAQLDPSIRYAVFVGDSITEGFQIRSAFRGAPVLNRGISSDGTSWMPDSKRPRGLTNRLASSVLDCQPAVVFLLIGTNDLPAEQVPMEYWLGHLEGIIDTITARHQDATVVMHTLPPTGTNYKRHAFLNPRILAYNEMLRATATRRGLPIIDLHQLMVDDQGLLRSDFTRDGLHPNAAAHALWAEAARPHLIAKGLLSAAQ